MSFEALALTVLIASQGDVADVRDSVEVAIVKLESRPDWDPWSGGLLGGGGLLSW